MRIGFTYDLKDDYLKEGYTKDQIAEFDSLVTIDAISGVIAGMGHTVDRIGNFNALSRRLLAGDRWDLVFNICEGLYGSGREALVPAMLDAYNIPYTFSDPLTHAISLNKAITKQILKSSGLPTSEFYLMTEAGDAGKLKAPFPHFVKAVSEGTGKGITPQCKVFSEAELRAQAAKLIAEFNQPVIVEPFLPGREVTVGVLGTGADAFCMGVMEVNFTDKADSDTHSYYNKEYCETTVIYTLATDDFARQCADISVRAHRLLNIRDACRVDMRADADGKPQIMEINTLPGLMPVRSDLVLLGDMVGYPHQRIVETIVSSAIKRCAK